MNAKLLFTILVALFQIPASSYVQEKEVKLQEVSVDLHLRTEWLLPYIAKAPLRYVSKAGFDDIAVPKKYIGPINPLKKPVRKLLDKKTAEKIASMIQVTEPKNKHRNISISVKKVADITSYHYNHWIKDIDGDNIPEIITTAEHLENAKCMAELDKFDVNYYKFNLVKSQYRLYRKETVPIKEVWQNYGNPYPFANREGKKLQKLAREKLGWWNGTKAYSTMDFDFDGKLEVYMRLEYDGVLGKYNTEPYPVKIWQWSDKQKKFTLWRHGRKRLEEFKYVDRTSIPAEINKSIPGNYTIKKVYKGFPNPDNKEKYLIYYDKVTWESRFDYHSMREGRLVLYYWADNNKLESKILYKNETDDAGYLVNFYVVDLIPPPEPEVILINRFHGGSGGSDRIRIFSVSIR